MHDRIDHSLLQRRLPRNVQRLRLTVSDRHDDRLRVPVSNESIRTAGPVDPNAQIVLRQLEHNPSGRHGKHRQSELPDGSRHLGRHIERQVECVLPGLIEHNV